METIPILTTESEVARTHGVAKPALRELRRGMLPRHDWQKRGRTIFFTEAGVSKVVESLKKKEGGAAVEAAGGLDLPDLGVGLDLEKNAAGGQPAEAVEALVVCRLTLNPRILICLTAEKKEVRCRVRSTEHFIPRMTLRARATDGGIYELVGRCPRWKGRW